MTMVNVLDQLKQTESYNSLGINYLHVVPKSGSRYGYTFVKLDSVALFSWQFVKLGLSSESVVFKTKTVI